MFGRGPESGMSEQIDPFTGKPMEPFRAKPIEQEIINSPERPAIGFAAGLLGEVALAVRVPDAVKPFLQQDRVMRVVNAATAGATEGLREDDDYEQISKLKAARFGVKALFNPAGAAKDVVRGAGVAVFQEGKTVFAEVDRGFSAATPKPAVFGFETAPQTPFGNPLNAEPRDPFASVAQRAPTPGSVPSSLSEAPQTLPF